MSAEKPFTKENLDICLKELAKEYRKYNGNKIPAEYLIAMKLMAGRQYKNDLSDIIGILVEQEQHGDAISLTKIKKAITDLYGNYECIPKNSRNFIESLYSSANLKILYKQYREIESENKDILINFQDDYSDVLNGNNLAYILKAAKAKKQLAE